MARLFNVQLPPHAQTDKGEDDDNDRGNRSPDGYSQDLPIVEDVQGALADAYLPMALIQVFVLIMAFCILGWKGESREVEG